MVTELQTRSQFSAYAILAAPMMISGSILDMTAETLATYTNKEVCDRTLDRMLISKSPLSGSQILGLLL